MAKLTKMTSQFQLSLAAILVLALAACSGDDNTGSTYRTSPEFRSDAAPPDSGLGITLFGDSESDGTEGAVAVNAFLWRASLDTISFMPLASADPFGGVIITDWFAPPETPGERFKVNMYILGRSLRADGLKVSVFRQTEGVGGRWTDAPVGADVPGEFEEAVLTRARQLRMQAVAEES
jgi:hypothetical protein